MGIREGDIVYNDNRRVVFEVAVVEFASFIYPLAGSVIDVISGRIIPKKDYAGIIFTDKNCVTATGDTLEIYNKNKTV